MHHCCHLPCQSTFQPRCLVPRLSQISKQVHCFDGGRKKKFLLCEPPLLLLSKIL